MVSTTSAKASGSAGGLINYLRDGMGQISGKVAAYYDTGQKDVLFASVEGECARALGFGPGHGMTRKEFEELYEGRWEGRQVLKGGTAPVWEKDANGREIKLEDSDNPGKWKRLPVMEPVLVAKKDGRRIVRDPDGSPVMVPKLDDSGEPVMKQKREYRFNSGYDVVFSANKSVSQYLVAHPEDADLVRSLFLQATNAAMRIGVEQNARMVRPRDAEGNQVRVKADGLMWVPSFGNVARPTKQSNERGFIGGDPHLHVHNFLFAWAIKDGQFMKIDGDDLMKQAEFRAHITDVEFTRLLQENGFEIDFELPDRKGRTRWELRGHDKKVMKFISSNTDRRKEVIRDFELEHKHPPRKEDVDQIMKATKGKKNGCRQEGRSRRALIL